MSLNAMREERAGLITAMRGILDAAKKENRDLNETEAAAYEEKEAQIAALDVRISREEKLVGYEASLDQVRPAHGARGTGIPRGGPEAKREFESLGEFMHAVVYGRNDPRLSWVDGKETNAADQRMDTGSAGGYMVPTQFRNTLMSVDPQDAIIRPRATVFEAGSPPDAAMSVPALDQSGTEPDNMVGGVKVHWTGEGKAVTESTAKFREIQLVPKELVGIVPMTNKMIRNWGSSSAVIEGLLRKAITAAEDRAFLRGDGVQKPLGILASGAVYKVNRATANTVAYDDLVDMYARLRGKGIWLYPKGVLPQLMKMEDSEGHLIWQNSAREGVPDVLMGLPAIVNERSPALGSLGDIMLIDPSNYLIKDGSGPIVSASTERHFEENRTLIKVEWNVDGQPWLTAPFKDESGYQVSPFVALDVPS